MNSRSLIICFGLSITLLATGCASLTQAAKNRGAYDFNCPEQKVTVKKIPGGSIGVNGCGKSAIYKCWQTGTEPNCILEKNIPKR